jgi:hypothetical protein
MTIPNTATTQVAYLITTEWGSSPINAYQIKQTSPYVFGAARSYAGVVRGPETTAETSGPVVGPVGLSAPSFVEHAVTDAEHVGEAVVHEVEHEVEDLAVEVEHVASDVAEKFAPEANA